MTIKTLNRPSNYMGYCDHCQTTFLTNELSCKIIDSKSYISLKCPKCGKEILSKQGGIYVKDPYRAMAEKPMDLEGYLKHRVKLLERDFKISPRKDEMDHLRSLKNEHQIDAAIRRIIDERWAT